MLSCSDLFAASAECVGLRDQSGYHLSTFGDASRRTIENIHGTVIPVISICCGRFLKPKVAKFSAGTSRGERLCRRLNAELYMLQSSRFQTLASRLKLTYMSIRDEITAKIQEGRLFRLKPINAKDQQRRAVLLSGELNRMVSGPWATDEMGRRCARLRGDLENLITAEFITVCWDPFKARDEQIGRLHRVEDEVWDLRSKKPKPGLRAFFRFADRDVFVVLTVAPRSVPVSWLSKLPLLGRETKEWRNAIVECRAEWTKLFPTYQPIHGTSIDVYLTGGLL
jgi:hypothetical protein